MTKEELLNRLSDIEWEDFEVKEASGGIPKSMWETVSAFSNGLGGWIVLGVKENKSVSGSTYKINGVENAEKIEQEIISTLRSRTKFNAIISCKAQKYNIDGKTVLAFEIMTSPHKPIAIKSTGEVFIRSGSGDVLASDLEVDAIVRDAAFGSRSEMEVAGSSFDDVNLESIASYRSYLRDFNRPLSYPELNDEDFCKKINIVLDPIQQKMLTQGRRIFEGILGCSEGAMGLHCDRRAARNSPKRRRGDSNCNPETVWNVFLEALGCNVTNRLQVKSVQTINKRT